MSTLLIVVGLLMILSPFIQEVFVKETVKATTRAFEHINHRQIKENLEKETEFEYEEIEDLSMLTSFESYVSDLSENVVGKVIIPSLKIDLPILRGVTNRNLNAGATTMRPDQEMGKGNYPLAGHIMKNKSLLFGALMDIQDGAIV
ncbi:class A sortase, partial [Bacillus licheniformis]|uniref:class A sortase n=1 Tax=Bacillus licheniformis TaxID=1402 RepID=UPI000FB17C52